MAKKKKAAAKAAPETPTDSHHVDEVDYESAPSDEEESRGATPTTNAEATLPARKEPSPSHESPSDSSSSSSSDAEEALRATIRGDAGKPMKPEELAMLLYTEEATARIVALREGRGPTPFSAGSELLAVSVANESLNRTNDKRSRGRGSSYKRSAGRSPSSNRVELCTHPTCRSKQGHSIDQCWTRAREERLSREAASGAAGASASAASSSSAGNKRDKTKKKRKPASEDDDSD